MLNNEDRADIGEEVVVLGATSTNVINVDDIGTAITDVLAYVAHFCDRIGIDPGETFAGALRSYVGDFEDGPGAEHDAGRFPDRGETMREECEVCGYVYHAHDCPRHADLA